MYQNENGWDQVLMRALGGGNGSRSAARWMYIVVRKALVAGGSRGAVACAKLGESGARVGAAGRWLGVRGCLAGGPQEGGRDLA